VRMKGPLTALMAALLLLLLLIPVGCGGGGGEGAISEIILSSLVLQDSFALYYPVPYQASPSVPAYYVSPNLSNVAGRAGVVIPAGTEGQLAETGFLVTMGVEDQIYQVYQEREGAKFIPVDALLHTFHVLYDYSLREMEIDFLLPDLEKLVASLHDTMQRMYEGSEGRVREAAMQDLAFLSVAAGLLEIAVDVPSEVQETVNRELELISASSGEATSPIFGYTEDYSQYVPRGHYTRNQEFEKYFKAMMWLGLTGFYPSPGTTPSEIKDGRDMTRQAILLVGALHMDEVEGEQALRIWDRIYQPTTFMVGAADDLDVNVYTRLTREVFGQSFPLSSLDDDTAVDGFIQRALEEQPPAIGSGREVAGEEGVRHISFRLFGQRFIPDSYIFQQLVVDEVQDRFMPRGLDIPAAFGSDRALQLLDGFYGDTQYEGYSENMQELRQEFSNLDPAQVHSNIYWGWLETMATLLDPCGEGYPAFMCGEAWQDRGLYAYLGSWAELRHDTILYAKQSYGATEAGPLPPAFSDKGYVEPRPEAFANLAATADMLRRGLQEKGLAGEAITERLEALYQLLIDLKNIAEKELRNEPLTEEEYGIIGEIGDTLEYLSTFPPEVEEELASETDSAMALVADVHTDPNYGEVLEVAVGRPAVYFVIAPVEGQPTLTVGAGLSYYEFVKPSGERLTDEAWQALVSSGDIPEPPAWTHTFLHR
jgi:hypothetical protein